MNKIIISGRLTRDPEIKFTQTTNKKVASISVAVRRSYKNQQGEYESDFFNCSAFGGQAEFLEKYFKKGQEILLSGRLQNRSWETESGEKRYATDIIVEEVNFIGSKQTSEQATAQISTQSDVQVNVVDDSDSLPF